MLAHVASIISISALRMAANDAILMQIPATGAGMVQIDESSRPRSSSDLRRAARPDLDLTTLDGLGDKAVIFSVIDMGDPEPETPETVAARIRAARSSEGSQGNPWLTGCLRIRSTEGAAKQMTRQSAR